MRKIFKLSLLVLALILTFQLGYAQKTVALNEDFTDNSNGWPVKSDDKLTVKIENGKYIWDCKSGDCGSDWFFIPVNFNPKKDFIIDVTFEKTGGTGGTSWCYAVVWGNDYMNRFSCYQDAGSVSVPGDVYTRIPSTYVQTGNGKNELTIYKKKKELQLMVNQKLIKIVKFKSFTSKTVGLYYWLDDPVTIEIDKILVLTK